MWLSSFRRIYRLPLQPERPLLHYLLTVYAILTHTHPARDRSVTLLPITLDTPDFTLRNFPLEVKTQQKQKAYIVYSVLSSYVMYSVKTLRWLNILWENLTLVTIEIFHYLIFDYIFLRQIAYTLMGYQKVDNRLKTYQSPKHESFICTLSNSKVNEG